MCKKIFSSFIFLLLIFGSTKAVLLAQCTNTGSEIQNCKGILSLHLIGFDDKPLSGRSLSIYTQKEVDFKSVLNKKLKEVKTDSNGDAKFEIESGVYAVAVRDDLGLSDAFYDLYVDENGVSTETIKMGKVNIALLNSAGVPSKGTINVYKLINIGGNNYKKDAKAGSFNISTATDYMIAANPYLFSVHDEWGDYGQALFVGGGFAQTVRLRVSSSMELHDDKVYVLKDPTGRNQTNSGIPPELRGRILLQVEKNGEAYYIHPDKDKKYYLKDGEAAFRMMRGFGLGISNSDLNKIPVGVDSRFNKNDTDEDGLADSLEVALGMQPYQRDSDADGQLDGVEVKSGSNPLGAGNVKIDKSLVARLKGRVVLQVQSHGEAWYINPADGRRYYMGDGNQAFAIMKFLSLGARNSLLAGIREGRL